MRTVGTGDPRKRTIGKDGMPWRLGLVYLGLIRL